MEKLTKSQKETKIYIETHNIEKLMCDMINALIYYKDPNPIIFILKYLADQLSEDDKEDYGISIRMIHKDIQMRLRQPSPSFDHSSNDLRDPQIITEHLSAKSASLAIPAHDAGISEEEAQEKVLSAQGNKAIAEDADSIQQANDLIAKERASTAEVSEGEYKETLQDLNIENSITKEIVII